MTGPRGRAGGPAAPGPADGRATPGGAAGHAVPDAVGEHPAQGRSGGRATPGRTAGHAKAGRTAVHAGHAAEEAAERLYRARGARVLARRWRVPGGEVDLVLAEGETTVFVEVKARRSLADAAEALRPAQARRLRDAALHWLAAGRGVEAAVRVDLVLVDRSGEVLLLENVLAFDG